MGEIAGGMNPGDVIGPGMSACVVGTCDVTMMGGGEGELVKMLVQLVVVVLLVVEYFLFLFIDSCFRCSAANLSA